MATIPLPALNVRPPEQPDVAQSMGNLMRLKMMMQQQQLLPGQLEMQQQELQQRRTENQMQQQRLKDQQTVMQWMGQNPGKTFGDAATALRGQVTLGTYTQLADTDATIRQKLSTATKTDLDNMKAQHDAYQNIYNNVAKLPDDQLAAQWPQIAASVNQIGGQLKVDPNKPMTQAQLQQAGLGFGLNEAYLAHEYDQREKKAKAGTAESEQAIKGAEAKAVEQGGMTQQMADMKYRSLQQQLAAKQPISADDQNFIKAYEKQKLLVPVAKFSMEAPFKQSAQSQRSYQFSAAQLDKVGQPIEQAIQRFGRLQDTVNQKTPQADALVAPELLTVMAGGQGSGLRMNEAEISRIVGGRSNLESLKAALNKWQIDPSKALSITDAQRVQIKSLMGEVNGKLLAKQKILDDARQALVTSDDPQEHRQITADARKKLTDIDIGQPMAAGTIRARDPQGKLHEAPAGTPLPQGWKREQ